MEAKKTHKILISGGGTGGHIFPAVAIANALKKLDSDIEILFVGAQDRMEMEKVPAAGYKIIGLPVMGFQRKVTIKNVVFFYKLFKSWLLARKILKNFKPDVVVGVGGFASGPMLRAASQKNIPTLIQEQNSYAGLTNKLLSKKVNKICVAYPGMEKYFPSEKILLTGNPVRDDIADLKVDKSKAFQYFGLDINKKTILSVGGSLGAKTINQSIEKNIQKIKGSEYQLLWQTGKAFYQTAKELVANTNATNICVKEFISQMDYAYSIADVVISRAGAIAISELALVAKPVILVPSPNVAEDHQTKNAMALVNRNAAILVKDIDAAEKLFVETFNLLLNEAKKTDLLQNISKFAALKSAEKIALEVLNLTKK